MLICIICHFETPLDDVALRGPDGHCVCLRCYDHENGTSKPMPKGLRRAIQAVLSER